MSAASDAIFLIGFPGVGKTTLGRAVSARTGVRFIDLDEAVEAEAGMSVPEIFRQEGEDAFRRRESAMLRSIVEKCEPVIVGCGGGTPCHCDNMTLMNNAGTTVWLQAPRERIVSRIVAQPGRRPLLEGCDAAGLDKALCELERRRGPFYCQAAETFDSSRLETEDEIAATADAFIKAFLI